MKYRLSRGAWLLLLAILPASAELRTAQPDMEQTQRWREFMRQSFLLHQRQIAHRQIRIEEEVGGYRDDLEFYREIRYYDAHSGLLLSKIQWERKHPDRVHAIWVQIHDDRNRIIRDYSGWYLPHRHHAAPRGAWVSLHAYNGDLRAFRQFDASNYRTYEFCRGTHEGKPVEISLSDTQLIEEENKGHRSVLASSAYRECFHGLPVEGAGAFLTPQ